MQIDIFSSAGSKVKTMELPASLFEATVNYGLMHQMVVLQQSNRRQSPAHVKTRAEVSGSTRKIVAQKHTGGARHGNIRNPLMRGGGKNFGPRNDKNYTKDMPQKMRQAALRSALTAQARKGVILGLEGYPETIKTSEMHDLLTKLPVDIGRRIVFVMPAVHKALQLSARNIEGVKTITANYLNLEDILNARHIIFVADAIEKAEAIFGKKEGKEGKKVKEGKEETDAPSKTKKVAAKKTSSKKS